MTIAISITLLDLEAVIVAGEIDRQLLREMIRRTQLTRDRIGWVGMVRPQLIEETIGADAAHWGPSCCFMRFSR